MSLMIASVDIVVFNIYMEKLLMFSKDDSDTPQSFEHLLGSLSVAKNKTWHVLALKVIKIMISHTSLL